MPSKSNDSSSLAGAGVSDRLMSLDALRGADMLCIIGGAAAILSFCNWIGWGRDCWLATQMTHVAWHGFRQHDTIFPLFLFLAGVTWPYSRAAQEARGRTRMQIVLKILRRALALILLGLVGRTLFSFDFAQLRYDSVLAHIGVCWAAAALLTLFVRSVKVWLAVAAALLVGHWALLYCFTAPDAAALLSSADPSVAKRVASYAAYGTDGFSFTGNIAGWVDRTFMPGRLHEEIFDPDGLIGKITGIVTALMGVMAGTLLKRADISGRRKTLCLVGAGLVALALCLVWRPVCPVNKKIWTSTFVLAAGSYSFLALALFYWLIDVKGWRSWSFFFRVIGMNSITIYIAMRFIDFRSIGAFFLCGVAGLGGPDWSAMVLALGKIAVEWIVLWHLYRTKTFLRV